MTTKTQEPTIHRRAKFLDDLSQAYNLRRKSLVLLTGDVHGLFPSSAADDFVALEEAIRAELDSETE